MSGDEILQRQVFEGWFWTAGDPRRAYGRLEHDLRDGPRLHLVGEGFVDLSRNVPIWYQSAILGETVGGTSLSVLKFWTIDWSVPTTLPQGVVIDGVAERVVVGDHVASATDVVANHFVCSLWDFVSSRSARLSSGELWTSRLMTRSTPSR